MEYHWVIQIFGVILSCKWFSKALEMNLHWTMKQKHFQSEEERLQTESFEIPHSVTNCIAHSQLFENQ